MASQETPLEATLKGAVSGVVGTAALTAVMMGAPAIAKQLGVGAAAPDAAQPAADFAGKVAEGVLDTSVGDATKQVGGQLVHWSYGAAWGALYGIVQSSVKLPHLLHGTIFGGIVAVVATTALPAMRLTPPPTQQPASMSGNQALSHMVYGWVTALTFHRLSKDG